LNKYKIVTDSCIDLSEAMAKELDLTVLPLTVLLEGKTYFNYLDEREITFKDFYQKLREKKMPSTSQLNPAEFEVVFEELLKEGYDILSISFSSALSGTYESAVSARDNLQKQYPEHKIVTIDSMCASMGQGLLLYYAAMLKKENKSLDQVAKWVEENKRNVSHLFTVGDLNHLKRGGRLSSSKAFLGTLINIKPLLHVSNEGKLVPTGQARGRRQALNKLIDRMRLTIEKPREQLIFISHADCLEDVEYLKEQIEQKIPVKEVVVNYIGPVIGSHSGLNTIALFYMGSDRNTSY